MQVEKGKYTKIRFENPEGLILCGLFLEAEGKPQAVLVVCHGFTGSKEGGGRTLEMGSFLSAKAGISVLVFDFAGNGESQGQFEDLTLSGQVKDLNAAVTWCRERFPLPVLTMGRSFGGTTVICQAAEDPRVRSVCSWAAPARPYELFAGLATDRAPDSELISLQSPEGSVRIRESFLDDLKEHDVLRSASRISPRRLLIVHGSRDESVPPREAEKIYAAAGEPKDIRLIPEADHRFQVNAGLAWEASLEWVQCVLADAGIKP
ncbi:MAG: alpha/beta hydrolase [Desulfohalobiaceae bacterium]|nr:alpha/beta hydrolase [Desulfohalobiaceae bacterium]